MNGPNLLLKFYRLPSITYDFSASNSSYSLSYLFRVLLEVSPTEVVELLNQQLLHSLDQLEPLLSFAGSESMIEPSIYISNETSPENIEKYQTQFKHLVTALGYIRLLSDIYCTHSLSHSKSLTSLIQTFSGETGTRLLKGLGRLQRYYENSNI